MELKCTHCNYEWKYKGKMILATCPSCCRKIKVENVE